MRKNNITNDRNKTLLNLFSNVSAETYPFFNYSKAFLCWILLFPMSRTFPLLRYFTVPRKHA